MKQTVTKPYIPRLRTHRPPRPRAGQSAQPRPPSTRDVGAFIREMPKFRGGRGEISHEQYQRLMGLACSAYVGQAVKRQIMRPLEKALSPERLARYLSPSHCKEAHQWLTRPRTTLIARSQNQLQIQKAKKSEWQKKTKSVEKELRQKKTTSVWTLIRQK